MTKEEYKKNYIQFQKRFYIYFVPFIFVLLIAFILEKLTVVTFAPQIYALSMGPLFTMIGILFSYNYYLAYKAEYIILRKSRYLSNGTIYTKEGSAAKKTAILLIFFYSIFCTLVGMLFSIATIYAFFFS